MTELTSNQRNEIAEQFAELVVDGMDTKDLVRYAREQLIAYHNEDSLECLKEDIDNYDDELFDELVDNVTNETVLDTNNNGGKF